MEVRVGFEPTVLRICNPVHWTALPPNYKYIMKEKDLKDIINDSLPIKYDDKLKQTLYEKGYLLGMLTKVIEQDRYVRSILLSELDKK